METELLAQGADLMLYGMGTVFAFLTILVFSTSLMSRAVNRFFPETVIPDTVAKTVLPRDAKQPVDARTLTIIQEAIYQHRAKIK